MTTATTGTTLALGTFLQSLITIVKTDALKDGLPIISAFFANISANPTQANIVAQLAVLEVSLMAALPNLESDIIKDLVALLQQQAAALTASIAIPAVTPVV
jgi:hypothetical protein